MDLLEKKIKHWYSKICHSWLFIQNITYENLALCFPGFHPYVFVTEQGKFLHVLEIKY